jgi:hypothetical protein
MENTTTLTDMNARKASERRKIIESESPGDEAVGDR